MNDDALMRSIMIYTLSAKMFEQARILANEEQDGRYNNWCTQIYGVMQDVQDKIREERVDTPIQIGSAPNIPTTNSATSTTNPSGNPNPTVNPTSTPTPAGANPVTNGGTTVPNANGGASQQQVIDFFSQVLAGKTSANGDLDDLLNQMIAAQQGQNNQAGNNQANF